ncbi:hypothetical protein VUR80DRAFT_9558 [Thermomyces stellatus]
MLSTLALLLPGPVHTSLSRLCRPAVDPEYGTPEPEWPDPRPATSSSEAPSSIPASPRRKGRRYSGTSSPMSEAPLVHGVRESLLEVRGGSSGINWDSVRRGLTKISVAAEETHLPPPTRDPSFERAEYISGLAHLHSALPPSLTPAELSTLRSSLPALDHDAPEPEPEPPRGTYLRRLVKSGVLSLLLLAALLLPHVLALIQVAVRTERRLGIGAGLVEFVRGAGRWAGAVFRSGLMSGLECVGGSVVGGLVEGVEEGVEMLREKTRPLDLSVHT